jgi:hypothetical protein
MEIKQNILNAVNEWLTNVWRNDTGSCQRITSWFPKELEESFIKTLNLELAECGVMGVGNNRINKYTLGKSTQGLSDYLHKAFLTNLWKLPSLMIVVTTVIL